MFPLQELEAQKYKPRFICSHSLIARVITIIIGQLMWAEYQHTKENPNFQEKGLQENIVIERGRLGYYICVEDLQIITLDQRLPKEKGARAKGTNLWFNQPTLFKRIGTIKLPHYPF